MDATGDAGAAPSTRQRWLLICKIVDDALALPEAQRRQHVSAACAGDTTLESDVLRLLLPVDSASSLGDTRIAVDAPAIAGEIPERIGHWCLRERIGSGGMGVVFRATREDGSFTQQVAIKLLSLWQISGPVMERFRQERQLLAGLNHPHIARLIDGGVADNGQPYIVMEYVEGLPIADYCDTHRLDPRARVRLILQVAEALSYAHRNLVIHRDVKPSNLLVTADGQVKLLDFGIAKLLDQPDSELTRTQETPMTPDFAAPEQLLGLPITVATDVYQLGMLLYQLVTGRRAYRRKPTSLYDLVRIVGEEDPSPPSAAVMRSHPGDLPPGQAQVDIRAGTLSRPALARMLRGDLDAIILKALDKQPERRYPSMTALASDLEAFVDGLPVMARRPTLLYRSVKLARRRPGGVAAVLLILLLLVAYAVSMTIQAQRIEQALKEAQLQARRAEQVSAFLKDVFKSADPLVAGNSAISARDLLDRNRSAIIDGLSDEPDIRADMLATLGTVYLNMGLYQDAVALLEPALDLRRQLPQSSTDALADTMMQLGNAYLPLDRHAEAEALLNEAVASFDQRKDWPVIRGEALVALGQALSLRGDSDRAESALQQAIDGLSVNADPRRHSPLAMALSQLGYIRGFLRDDFAGAEQALRLALEEQKLATGEQHPRYGLHLNSLAEIVRAEGRDDEARALAQRSVDIQRAVFGQNHPEVAEAMRALAEDDLRRGLYAQAIAGLEQVAQIQRDIGQQQTNQYAITLRALGIAQSYHGDNQAARRTLLEALEIDRRNLSPTDTSVGQALSFLGWVGRRMGDYAWARQQYLESLAIMPEDSIWQAGVALGYTRLLLDSGDIDGALHWGEVAYRNYVRIYSNDHSEVAKSHTLYALAQWRKQPTPESLSQLQAAWQDLQAHGVRGDYRALLQQALADAGAAPAND